MKIELHDFDPCLNEISNEILTLICQNTDKFKISEISLFLSEYAHAQSSTITLACDDKKMNILLADILYDKRNSK